MKNKSSTTLLEINTKQNNAIKNAIEKIFSDFTYSILSFTTSKYLKMLRRNIWYLIVTH